MNIPPCKGGRHSIAHDFDLVGASAGVATFPYLRACRWCGVLELVITIHEAVYFTPWTAPKETDR